LGFGTSGFQKGVIGTDCADWQPYLWSNYKKDWTWCLLHLFWTDRTSRLNLPWGSPAQVDWVVSEEKYLQINLLRTSV